MLRSFIKVFVPLALALLIAGCSGSSEEKRNKRLFSKELVFPSSLEIVEGTQKDHQELSTSVPRLLVYIDSTECSSCRIDHLHMYSEYMSTYPDLEIFVIIWPNAETEANVANDIAHRKLPFDVFIDRDGSFLDANPHIPRQGRNNHSFLLGSDGKPIIAGDPLSGPGRARLLLNTLYSVFNEK